MVVGPRRGPCYSIFVGFRFPDKPLKPKKGTLFIPTLLLGHVSGLNRLNLKGIGILNMILI